MVLILFFLFPILFRYLGNYQKNEAIQGNRHPPQILRGDSSIGGREDLRNPFTIRPTAGDKELKKNALQARLKGISCLFR